ncbi:MAG: DNA gyrase subunit A [Eubacteriales bacterium]|nr:DNA gyrase subunit A [Eubacteriales bacterium]
MPKKKETPPPRNEVIVETPLETVLHESMIPFAEYAILHRALPRVEDGLKPVQRRILYTMMELGITPDKPYRKSARIVGDTMGKYHPHGDTSIYDAMVRMAQDFNMGATLVDGHGNYGSVDGDSAAAMRYTEARMTPLALELLRDIEKDTVSFSLNFDDSLKEPDMLPGRFPNLLVNGAKGIAVGLATEIPPHNLGETIDAVVAQMDNPDITLDELMQIIKGPDFPTGGYILGSDGIRQMYETGKGRIVMRAKAELEKGNAGKTNIVITEIPFQVNKARMLEEILRLSESKKGILAGISDIRDESDRDGMRAVIEVKRDCDAQKILEYLYKYSDLQCNFNANMVAIADGRPKLMTLKEINAYYIKYQKDVVRRRTQFDLEKAEAREHILIGLKIAIVNIDEVVRLIKTSASVQEAKRNLMRAFDLTGIQAQAILDMRLQRLTSLEVTRLEQELAEVQALIKELKAILRSAARLVQVIKDEMLDIRKRFAIRRRCKIMDAGKVKEFNAEDFIVVEDAVAVVTRQGYVKRMNPNAYSRSNRSTMPDGMTGGDVPAFELPCNTRQTLMLFTDRGNAYTIPCADLKDMRWRDRGEHLSAVIHGYDVAEEVVYAYTFETLPDRGHFVFFTRQGMVKKTAMSEYDMKKRRVVACGLKEGDAVVGVVTCARGDKAALITARGQAICFKLSEAADMGRAAKGVKGITLEAGDTVIWAGLHSDEAEVLMLSDKGYAKRMLAVELEMQGRAGKGGKVFPFYKNGANGEKLAWAQLAAATLSWTVRQKSGQETEMRTDTIPLSGRTGSGTPVIIAVLGDTVEQVVDWGESASLTTQE